MPADIRVDSDFPNHRKTKKLIQKLGFSGPTHLLFLWVAASKTRPKGVLEGMDENDIALDGQWPGDPKEFVEALLSCGYLEKNGDDWYCLHGWSEHQPWVYHSDERSNQAREAAQIMWDKKRSKRAKQAGVKRNASVPHSGEQNGRNAPSPSPSPFPYPIPSPIEVDVWKGFVEMRKKIKKPLTDHAAILLLADALKIAKEHSQDPNEIINQSTKRSWQGLFEVKATDNGTRGSPTETPIGASEELARRWNP